MAENALHVEPRKEAGKGVARKLRAAGRIPGTCYGQQIDPVSVSLDPRVLERLLAASAAGMNTLIDLHVEGGGAFDGKVVLVKELQRDPVQGNALHADLLAVDVKQVIQVSVPIHIRGIAVGVTAGGILDQSLREVEVECLPTAIPEELVIDVSALELGDSLHVRDIALPEGVTLESDGELAVVSVVAPRAEEEAAPAEGAAAAEGEAAPAEGAASKEDEEDGESEKGD